MKPQKQQVINEQFSFNTFFLKVGSGLILFFLFPLLAATWADPNKIDQWTSRVENQPVILALVMIVFSVFGYWCLWGKKK